jgi:hypothetical protein
MAKKVQIAHPRAVTRPDDWVNQKPAAADDVPMKRLTVDIPEDLHARIKIACATKREKMSDAVRALLESHWPAEKAAKEKAA